MTALDRLSALPVRRRSGARAGIASVCSAHPLVIEAALIHGRDRDADVLIEATCNQVNHEGGYTGMTPAAFRDFVGHIAKGVGFPEDRLVLGGDHLGPNPWKHLPALEAMAKARAMVAAYAEAGFAKIHLDASMGCAGEPAAPPENVIAARAAELAEAAEAAAAPVYVIGTEVPVPGGATEALDHLATTRPEDVARVVDLHAQAFEARGIAAAFGRAIAVVVQPGVEFADAEVAVYRPEAARGLTAALERLPLVYEAHSTDYQPGAALRALVDDGFAILKVGPWLTFALREALYGLAAIADWTIPDASREPLPGLMERVMLAAPGNWAKYYHGDEAQLRLKRHFSFSDRIRYYWTQPAAEEATARLLDALGEREIPLPLISQHLGALAPDVAAGRLDPTAPALLRASVTRVLDLYAAATD